MWDNKIDHSTYFGTNPVLIQGIQMLPIVSMTAYMRTPTFVKEEYARWFDDKSTFTNGYAWEAVIKAGQAVADPTASWRFFADPKYEVGRLWDDLGTPMSWYMWYAAALGAQT
jgi:endo-1,3(4)-beta-glucanase